MDILAAEAPASPPAGSEPVAVPTTVPIPSTPRSVEELAAPAANP
jgi:hypothetical protein